MNAFSDIHVSGRSDRGIISVYNVYTHFPKKNQANINFCLRPCVGLSVTVALLTDCQRLGDISRPQNG